MAHEGVRIPLKHFIDTFWPMPPGVTEPPLPAENPFSEVTASTLEKDVAEAFCRAVTEKKLTPGMVLCLSPSKPDETSGEADEIPGKSGDNSQDRLKDDKIQVDGAFFRDDDLDIPVPADNRPHYSDQVVAVEFKRADMGNDPFSDGADPIPAAQSRKAVRGQIISYAERVFSEQHRVAFFMFVVVGNMCRITRWDRSGVIFTVSFNYYEKWRLFCKVLWRMSQCSDEQLGRDPTAVRISPRHTLYPVMDSAARPRPEEIDHMEQLFAEGTAPPPNAQFRYVRDLFRKSISNGAPRYALAVPHEGTVRHFLVGNAVFKARGMAGRATRGFVAYDAKTGELVWVKDSWRADYLRVQHEGEILRELNDANVPYVPTVLCYGDLVGQKTVTPVMWDWGKAQSKPAISVAIRKVSSAPSTVDAGTVRSGALQPEDELLPAAQPDFDDDCPLRSHQHTRVVVKEVALPLRRVHTALQLIHAVFHCIFAHQAAAMAPVSRLHRDISGGNIMILPKVQSCGVVWTGLLCDWEMSKKISQELSTPRQPVRSGTIQYMSVALLSWPKRVEISDELESFFHVLLYYAVRYFPSSFNEEEVRSFIDEYFDYFVLKGKRWACGTRKQAVLATNRFTDVHDKPLTFTSPLDRILRHLLKMFHSKYIVQLHEEAIKTKDPQVPAVQFLAAQAPPLDRAFVFMCTPAIASSVGFFARVQQVPDENPVPIITEDDRSWSRYAENHDAILEYLWAAMTTYSWPTIEARDRYVPAGSGDER
ncbi:hypothetical protein GY45DRAFT_1438912 [Cubamyces sp. BRFM 1775]|nr:hypothetical protein GY45DRAFT_1438912 [Cubamyces sp. BRFM 1775]